MLAWRASFRRRTLPPVASGRRGVPRALPDTSTLSSPGGACSPASRGASMRMSSGTMTFCRSARAGRYPRAFGPSALPLSRPSARGGTAER
eukprot:13237466-Alexandrium_andersonii.AAC.1